MYDHKISRDNLEPKKFSILSSRIDSLLSNKVNFKLVRTKSFEKYLIAVCHIDNVTLVIEHLRNDGESKTPFSLVINMTSSIPMGNLILELEEIVHQ